MPAFGQRTKELENILLVRFCKLNLCNFLLVKKDEIINKKPLSPKARRILEGGGTELPFSGKFYKHKKKGSYLCAACGNGLFSSDAKYDSGSGWPSFYETMDKTSVDKKEDKKLGMVRTEIACSQCGGHLGHVFPDGPKPTGLRYCVNSLALEFKKE